MKLSAFQRRQLDALSHLKTEGAGLWKVLTFRPLSWIPFVLIGTLSVLVFVFVEPRWGLVMIGLTAGAVLRILAQARFTVMAWPVTETVTDWAKVEALRKGEGAEVGG